MMAAYQTGDPYFAFAKQAGAVPPDGIRKDYETVRDLYKGVCLGIQYGMGRDSLAMRLGVSTALAQRLLDDHKRIYRRFWEWADAAVDYAVLRGRIHTIFGCVNGCPHRRQGGCDASRLPSLRFWI
jgi:DNA polymerase I